MQTMKNKCARCDAVHTNQVLLCFMIYLNYVHEHLADDRQRLALDSRVLPMFDQMMRTGCPRPISETARDIMGPQWKWRG